MSPRERQGLAFLVCEALLIAAVALQLLSFQVGGREGDGRAGRQPGRQPGTGEGRQSKGEDKDWLTVRLCPVYADS